MPRVLSTALALCLLGLSLIAQTSPPALVIVNARIVDVAAGRARKVAALVIESGRIAALHDDESATLPSGAEKIDGSGLTLVPGLVDLAVQAQPSMDLDVDYFYALSLAHGVTTIRTVDARLVWAVEQRERLRTGAVVGPRLVTSGPLIDSRGADPLSPIPMPSLLPATVVGDTAAAVDEVTRQRAGRADWVRFSSRVGADLLRPALPVARKSGLRVSAAAGAASMAQLAQLGVGAIDGLGPPVRSWVEYESMARRNGATPDADAVLDAAWAGLSAAEQRTLVQRLVRARTPVVPMLRIAADRVLAADDEGLAAERKLAPARGRATADRARAGTLAKAGRAGAEKATAARYAFVTALVRAGGRVGTASGAGVTGWPVPGLGLQRELVLLVEAGLTPAEALRAATIVGAEVLGLKGVGQILVGYRADLFGVRADPLAGIAALSDVALVVREGERLERTALLRTAERATRVVK
jgi:hypothetical protein